MDKLFNVREFESEEEVIKVMADIYHKYQLEKNEVDTISHGNLFIVRERLKNFLDKKRDDCEGKTFHSNTYQEDRNDGWVECLEWLLEAFE